VIVLKPMHDSNQNRKNKEPEQLRIKSTINSDTVAEREEQDDQLQVFKPDID
jgi:hypothetical protein